jgi:lysophospholipase L1-like esterase
MARRSLLCFGDSNTHGTVALRELGARDRLASDSRWPGVLAGRLGPGWQVVEEGHPGRTTVHDDPIEGAHRNGRTALPVLLESHRPLDAVIVMLGTNDLKARFSLPAFDIALGVEKIATDILRSEAGPDGGPPALLLVAPVPILETGLLGPMFEGGCEKSRRLAPLISDLAARLGVAFVDAGAHAAVDPVDGIHLDATAHATLGAAFADAVEGLFP